MSFIAGRRRAAALLAGLGLLVLVGCQRPAPLLQQESFVFGTQVELTVAGLPEAESRAAMAAVLAEFDRLHRLLHAWQPSELTQVNEAIAAGRAHAPPAEVLDLIVDARRIAAAGDHLFDPGIGRLIALWGFHGDEFKPLRPPEEALVAWRQQRPSIADLTIRDGQVSSAKREVALDLGGYAKGVALDRAAAILHQRGVHNALINIGGNVMALGDKNGTPWKVGIRQPRGSGYLAALELRDGEAIGTSGDYQRYFELDGRRYSHLLDPRSGEPAQGTQAVTVLISPGPSVLAGGVGMRSDALSKPLFIAGSDRWLAMAGKLGVEQVLRVDADGSIAVSEKLAGRLSWPAGAVAALVVRLP
jgi:thiamine biosynthesis lipoprotein